MHVSLKSELGQLLSELEGIIRNENYFLIPGKLSEIYAMAVEANRDQIQTRGNQVLAILRPQNQ